MYEYGFINNKTNEQRVYYSRNCISKIMNDHDLNPNDWECWYMEYVD